MEESDCGGKERGGGLCGRVPVLGMEEGGERGEEEERKFRVGGLGWGLRWGFRWGLRDER